MDKTKQICRSAGLECIINNFERVYRGDLADGKWVANSIRTRTSNIKRIINEKRYHDVLIIARESKFSRINELAITFEKTLKRLNLI